MNLTKTELREMKKAAERAANAVIKSIKEEPSTVIVMGTETGESQRSIQEITTWLFKEEDDGNSNR